MQGELSFMSGMDDASSTSALSVAAGAVRRLLGGESSENLMALLLWRSDNAEAAHIKTAKLQKL
jgi:hypothetical protein